MTSVDVRAVAYRRRGHFGAWRALAALPAVVGGALVMLVMTAPLKALQLPVLLLWLIAWRAALPSPATRALHALLAVALLQFALGVATLLLVVPIPLAW